MSQPSSRTDPSHLTGAPGALDAVFSPASYEDALSLARTREELLKEFGEPTHIPNGVIEKMASEGSNRAVLLLHHGGGWTSFYSPETAPVVDPRDLRIEANQRHREVFQDLEWPCCADGAADNLADFFKYAKRLTPYSDQELATMLEVSRNTIVRTRSPRTAKSTRLTVFARALEAFGLNVVLTRERYPENDIALQGGSVMRWWQFLRTTRRHMGWSQQELADAAGVPRRRIIEIESNRSRGLTCGEFFAVWHALGVEPLIRSGRAIDFEGMEELLQRRRLKIAQDNLKDASPPRGDTQTPLSKYGDEELDKALRLIEQRRARGLPAPRLQEGSLDLG